MDRDCHTLIEALHRSSHRCAIAVTGGGTGAVAALLNVPGGSRTILEAVVPYHEQALTEYLGHRPESFCSVETTCDIAARARERACWLAPGETVVGLGCTAGLVSDRPKRGDHRFHISTQTAEQIRTYSLTLNKGARDREGEEAVLDAVLLNALAEAFEIVERVEPALLPGEQVQVSSQSVGDLLASLCRGEMSAVCVEVDGRLRPDAPKPRVLLPGAFNPIHEGHWKLAGIAERITGTPVTFELSVSNVDKGTLPLEEVRRRVHQFVWKAPLWLTRAPTFVEKAALFPGVVFVVGADTAKRIVEARYYHDSEEHMIAALTRIRELGCRFLVAGRQDSTGAFIGVERLTLPESFRELFTGIPEREFKVDVSSTQLREANLS